MAVCKTNKCQKRRDLVDGYCADCIKNQNKPKSKYKYKCNACDTETMKDDSCLCCDYCSGWFHITCVDIPQQLYEFIVENEKNSPESGLSWYCRKCKLKAKEAVTKFASLEQKTTKLQTDMVEVQEKIASIESTIKTKVRTTISETMAEKDDIENRKHNLIVYGLPEPNKPGDVVVWETEDKIDKDISTISTIITTELTVSTYWDM